jgi:hypothetical protein
MFLNRYRYLVNKTCTYLFIHTTGMAHFRNMFLNKEARQCAYNVTWKCVRATVVAVEKQYVLPIVSVCL